MNSSQPQTDPEGSASASSHRPGEDPELPKKVELQEFELKLMREVQKSENPQATSLLLMTLWNRIKEDGKVRDQLMAIAEEDPDYRLLIGLAKSLPDRIEDVMMKARGDVEVVKSKEVNKEKFIQELKNEETSYVIDSTKIMEFTRAKKNEKWDFAKTFKELPNIYGKKKKSALSYREIINRASSAKIPCKNIKNYTSPDHQEIFLTQTYLVTSEGHRVLFEDNETYNYAAIWIDTSG